MNGKFTGPTHFEGRVEYEAATFPEPPRREAGPSAWTRNFSTSTWNRPADPGRPYARSR